MFPQPFGVSYSGATFKYTVLDTTGQRAAAAGKSTAYDFTSGLNLPQSHNYLKQLTNPF